MKIPFPAVKPCLCALALGACASVYAAVPRVSILATNKTWRLNIQSDTGVTIQIQSCTNLTQANWVTSTNLLATNGTLVFWPADTTAPRRYYRALELGLDHFAISTISSPQVAGVPFVMTVTAQDAANYTVRKFTNHVTFGGTLGLTRDLGNFSSGVLTNANVIPTLAGNGLDVTVNDGLGHTGSSSLVTVNPGPLDHFTISPVSSPQMAGTAITSLALSALDAYDNLLNTGPNAFTGTVAYGGTAGITGNSAAFTAGQRTVSVTPSVAGIGRTFTVSALGKGATNTFDVNPGALDHFAISSISSPQTAGTAIPNIVLTAQDANNNLLNMGPNAFTGTVIYGGTAGIIGVSGAFTAGQLSGVSVTPTVAGIGQTFTVTALGKTGTISFDVNPLFTASQGPMALIPAGTFSMGDSVDGIEIPVHTVNVDAFYMDTNLVSYSFWASNYQWATNHGYNFTKPGSGKGAQHPVQTITWNDAVKWCNARSEQEHLVPCYYTTTNRTTVYRVGVSNLVAGCVDLTATGYRLPTEAEWEKAARGGSTGLRFPWSTGVSPDKISQIRANYIGNVVTTYDLGPTGYNPTWDTGGVPYTSAVGSFAPNGYGLYDMAGNVREWCWDWYLSTYYSSSPTDNPVGPSSGSQRVVRGGAWNGYANVARCSARESDTPSTSLNGVGFRCVRRQ